MLCYLVSVIQITAAIEHLAILRQCCVICLFRLKAVNFKMYEMKSFAADASNFKTGFKMLPPEKKNVIYKYRWLLLHFILMMVSSLKRMSVKNSLILLVIRNISILKNSFAGEFLRFAITLTLFRILTGKNHS